MDHVSVGTTGWVGLHPKEYARHFDTVEFNWTFHEREESIDQFQKSAQELLQLRIQAILKVSGLATHENRLKSPEKWWPSLWAKYSQLHQAGVLGGLLWQLAPSHRCSHQALRELECLAKILPRDVLHIFEFRHSSWYHRKEVLETLRRHRFCMAWIHIANEDGWCGDLPSGWACLDRTCPSVYFRLFGTKSKAVGRYPEEFLRRELLPFIVDSNGPEEIFIMFAQADVPDHAKADGMAVVELIGRVPPNPTRSTRWERDVLAASLGLGIGIRVDGTVQRMTHRTIFIDIGRSCRACLCVHHARRVGLLENLHVGTGLHGLVVENIEFQAEWGIVGLTCHDAVIGIVGGDLSVADPSTIAVNLEKKSRWGKVDGVENAEGQMAVAVADALPNAGSVDLAKAVPVADSEACKTRWSRRTLPPAAMKREEEALERAEIRKAHVHIYVPLPSAEPRNSSKRHHITKPSDDTCRGSIASRNQGRKLIGETPIGESEDGPKALSADDFLLMQLERREGTELGFDHKNDQTFGLDHDPHGWDAEAMFRANGVLREVGAIPRSCASSSRKLEYTSGESEAIVEGQPSSCKQGQNFLGASLSAKSESKGPTIQKKGRNKIQNSLKAELTKWSMPRRPRGHSWADLVEEEEEDQSNCRAEDTEEEQTPVHSLCSELDWPPIILDNVTDGTHMTFSEHVDDKTSHDIKENSEKYRLQDSESANDLLQVVHADDKTEAQSAIPPVWQSSDASEAEDGEPELESVHAEEVYVTDEEYCFEGDGVHNIDDVEPRQHLMELPEFGTIQEDNCLNGRAESTTHVTERASQSIRHDEALEPESLDAFSNTAEKTCNHGSSPQSLESSRKSTRWARPTPDASKLLDGEEESPSSANVVTVFEEQDSYSIVEGGSTMGIDERTPEISRHEEEVDDDDISSDNCDDAEDGGEEEEEDGDIFLAVCDKCGTTHLMDIDVMGLGLEFTCAQLGLPCEGDTEHIAAAMSSIDDPSRPAASVPVPPPKAAKLDALTPEEKKDIFQKHAMQLHLAKLKPNEVHKEVKQLFAQTMPKERYRNSEIVTRKGERFIKINLSLDPGPGCEIGGILGWRSKMGRRGLGLKKMTKEEADRVCVSNKNRSHIKKDTGPAGSKQAYVFENRWSQHTPATAIGTAPKRLSS